jgi:hypothetical protein
MFREMIGFNGDIYYELARRDGRLRNPIRIAAIHGFGRIPTDARKLCASAAAGQFRRDISVH